MKNIISLVLAFCVTAATFAQIPQSFGFQTVVRNNNKVLSNCHVGARFTILKNTATGTSVYCETQDVYTSTNGVATFEVGKGSVVSGVFADISWGTAKHFLKTELDPDGGTNYTITETVELRSVPYALFSGMANTYSKFDSLKALYNNRLHITDSLIDISISNLRHIDSLILIRIYSDSVFRGGIGRFATSDTTFITFSPANLWYRPSDSSWKMPDNQWDTAGQYNNSQLAVNFSEWIDMLTWATSGYNDIYPTDTSQTGSYFGNGINSLNGTPYDWAYFNTITFRNQPYTPDTWRTPTDAEWTYIMTSRPNAVNMRCLATVNGIQGLVLLPDDWPGMPLGCSFQPITNNWNTNIYDGIFWTAMESQGAVFIPAAGYLHRSAVPMHCHDQGMQGFYWSETSHPTNSSNCYYMNFGLMGSVGGIINAVYAPSNVCGREFSHNVRLVKDLPRTE